LGRWDLSAALTEVSTVAFIETDNQFTIQVADGVVGPVDIVATPIAGTLQPTLRLTLNPATANVVPPRLVRPDTAGDVDVSIVVQGTGTGGGVTGVIGARVTVSGSLAGGTAATFSTQGDSDATGAVTLKVPGGALASSYRVSVVPQTNANVGVVFDRPLTITEQTNIKLPDRLAIVGTVVDHEGNPLKDVQVTAHPSLRFQWSLSTDPQAFVAGIPPAAIVTENSGEFVLFVDPFIAADGELENEDVWGYYDISFVPTDTTNAPLWSQMEIEIPRDPTLAQLAVGAMGLPDAAHIHGSIVDPFGELVEDAELKLFRVEDPQAFALFCADLNNAPASCPVPAFLLGRGVSDADGVTRLTLPRL
nr:hypothetical protein [Deltaproteobacteria bacterium]